MSVSAYLRHLHIPKLTPYFKASTIQDSLVSAHLQCKVLGERSPSPRIGRPPPPTLITFQTPPTYTCGRREIGTLSHGQIDYLKARGTADFYEALRGGQTTFHGPGQLVAYLICDLRTHGISPREYVRLLEDAVIRMLDEYGLRAHTTKNPGVWIGTAADGVERDDDRKIASVGVHLRRHVSSHGVGVNISTDLSWFDRIVACGLPGRKATSLVAERLHESHSQENAGSDLHPFGSSFARQLARNMRGVHRDIKDVTEEDVQNMIHEIM